MKIQFKLAIHLFLVIILLMAFTIPVFAQTETGPGQAITVPAFQTTPEILAAIAGVILSLLFSYVPKLNTLFAGLDSTYKRLVMVLLLLIVSVAIYGLGCVGILQSGLTCDKNGLIQLVWIFILAVMANQGTYTISPQANSVKALKE